MRYFVCMLLLLLALWVVVEARRWKGKPDVCRHMFVKPRIAFKRCNEACWKIKNCWGYCDAAHGRKQCICGDDCERECPSAPTGKPATSPPAPTEQPATTPSAPNVQPATIYIGADAPYDESQKAVYVDHVEDQFFQMMEQLDIAYEGMFTYGIIDHDVDGIIVVMEMPKVECKKVPAMLEILKSNFPKIKFTTMPCGS